MAPFSIKLDEKFPPLSKASVTEAVLEFRTRAILPWEEERLNAGLRERLPDYPQRQRKRLQEGAFQFGSSPEARINELGWFIVATSEDGQQIVQFHQDRFVFNCLAPYKNWEAFQEEGLRLWHLYRELAAPDKIQRMGVRFINQFSIQLGADIDDFFHAAPKTPAGLEQLPLSGFLHRETLTVPDYPYEINIIRTVQPGESQRPAQLILDIDVFTITPLSLDEDPIKERLREMRWLKNKAFFGSVTNKIIKSLQGET